MERQLISNNETQMLDDPFQDDEGAEENQADLDGVMQESDEIFDRLQALIAENYLQHNRQTGAQ